MRNRIARFILARIGYRTHNNIRIRDHHHNGLRTITVDVDPDHRLRATWQDQD